MKYELRYYGDPILRQKAEEVKEITDEIREMADVMLTIMRDNNGMGIAAPQIGVPLRFFVSIVKGVNEQDEIIYGDPIVFINPTLSNIGEGRAELNEACLSLPKMYGSLIRPLSVTVEAINIDGEPFKLDTYGYHARHIFHETDHLNGILYIDHIKGKKRTLLEPHLRRIKQQYYRKRS